MTKHLARYINERLISRKHAVTQRAETPATNAELRGLIADHVKDLMNVFCGSSFNGDISEWDVSKVKNHESIFEHCPLADSPEKQCKFI